MTPRSRRLAIAAALLIPLGAGAFAVQERATANSARLFDQVLSIVGDRFVDSISTGALYEKAARGMVEELKDPYSELYTPKEFEAFNTTLDRAERNRQVVAMMRIFTDELPALSLYFQPSITAYVAALRGPELTGGGWDVHTWEFR